ncbi:hypothetical protein BCV73_08820 [Paenibacillus sp. SSG-1]|uniref:hypothetical protein n=1 Tax=Paenibacillus sp. SSG-1 TaxID=1443669 RepID=UPI000B7DDC0D|nr:hypothetical protein [Paenibacillus sp. SSG-1]OXL83169.1 hypothetical protein BCV73_08820 [Paenibacillus sp. SSG-1]
MSNPASITIGNIKYNIGNQHLLKLDDNEKLLNAYHLSRLELRTGINLNSGNVYSLEVIISGSESFTIHDKDVDKGDLTRFYELLSEKINFLTKNPELVQNVIDHP